MAQANKNKNKKKTSGPDALVIIYGIDPETDRYAALRGIVKERGVRPKVANETHLGDPIGSLAHLVGFRPNPLPYDGHVPEAEMLVFCNVGRKTLDEILAAMREAEIDIPLKAVMTECNMRWTLHRLFHELSDEHDAMCGQD